MKTKLILLGLTILTILTNSCDENSNNPESVETFIGLLRSNQYNSINLPAFRPQDIPALLDYRNETQMISNYPRNPISSFSGPECSLGMYVLWTIESIRVVPTNNPLTQRFPSQNPVLALRDQGELRLVSDITSHTIAAKAYYDWWKNNAHKDFNDFRSVDPLKDTDYKWH